MGDDITIGVTEIVNNIEVTAQPNDQIVDISVTDNADNVTLNITPTVIEINVNKGSSYAKWGDIYGTLSDQTDLQNALNLKANLVGGKVPASELPSYVDDIIEVANYAALPATGEIGKIYVTLDNNKIYRWSGSVYIEIASNTAIWGAITGTLSSQTDLQNALNAKFNNPTGNTTQYIAGDGSLITFPVAGQSGTLVREVRNTTGATLLKGTVVYINGATGNKPTVAKAIATGDSTSAQTFGIIQADLANNANGYVVCVGDIVGLDTSAITEGTQLYLSSTTAGAYTTTKQLAPAHLVYIGIVTRSHPTQGQIEVKIQNGYELDEIHDVAISSKANNQILAYESATDLWKNKSIATVLGYTPANDASVVKVTTDQNVRGIKTFLGDQTATTLKLIVADYYNDGFITSDNGMLRLLNGTTELFNLASTGDLTAKSFVKTGGTASQFLKANGTVDSTTYLSGTVAIANGGTGATTASAARTNLGATTIGSGLFTLPNAGLVSFLRVNADNTVELLGADLFRTSIGAGTGNGSVTSVSGTGSYGGLTLTGTVTGSGDLTLGGTPTGTWPISITGNASSVNTVQVSTNADFYLTFADANNGSPTSEFLYTIGTVKVNPSTGALTAGSFVKSGGTSSQYLMADGSVSTGSGGTVTGTGTTNYIPKFTGASSIGDSLISEGSGVINISGSLIAKNSSNYNGIIVDNSTSATIGGGYIGLKSFNVTRGLFGVAGAISGSTDNNIGIFAESGTGMGAIKYYVNGSATASHIMHSNGNVTIGTPTEAGYKLDVNGITRIQAELEVTAAKNSSWLGSFSNTGTTNAHGLYVNIGASSTGVPFAVYKNFSSLFTIANDGAATFNSTLTTVGYIRLQDSSVLNLGYNQGGGATLKYNSNGNLDITPRAGYNSVFTGGNVGIGTANPTEKLQLVGGIGEFVGTSIDSQIRLTAAGVANTIVGFNNSGSNNFANVPNNSAYLYCAQGYPLLFGTNSAERMRILSDGNVGINTSTPVTRLSLNSYSGSRLAYIQDTSFSIDGAGITIGSSTTTGNKAGGLDLTNNTYSVGAYSPIISFSSRSSNSVYNCTYAGIWGINAGQGSDANWVKGDLVFGTAPSNGIQERMRIFSNGNVSINSNTDAGYKLDVNGGLRSVGNSVLANTFTFINLENNCSKLQVSRFLAINDNASNVGIGYSQDSVPVGAKLAVNGNSYFGGTITATGGFFNSDIRLKEIVDYDYNVSNIKPITYLWKDGRDDKKHVGYSAQEVQKVMPDAVNQTNDGTLSVNYIEVLVAKIAELENRIKQLEK